MRIFVQGRKDGYKKLYTYPGSSDLNNFESGIVSSNTIITNIAYLGKSFYSIAFAVNGCIFTQYILGFDVDRSAIGYIGFSIFVPDSKKLLGNDIKLLLDSLINKYKEKYISNNRLIGINEDWTIFTALADSYDSKLIANDINYNQIESGEEKPAFHYYTSDEDLIKLFDNPYQDEYRGFKQVFFIDDKIKHKTNPIDQLDHSGKEVNPDLENNYYFLSNYKAADKVNISINNKVRSDRKGENIIRAKDTVRLSFSKDERCYEKTEVEGKLIDKSSDIHKYLKNEGNRVLINHDALQNPIKKKKDITFSIKNRKGETVEGTRIKIGNKPTEEVNDSKYTHSFEGEEIINKWNIEVSKDGQTGNLKTFIPYDNNVSVVEIEIAEKKVIPIKITDANSLKEISNFEVRTKLTEGYQQTNKLEFINEQNDESYDIEIRKEGYRSIDIKDFIPRKENSIKKELKKIRYGIDPGEHGRLKSPPLYTSSKRKGEDVENSIIADKDWSFIGFKLDELNKRDGYDGTLIAQYKEKKSFIKRTSTLIKDPKLIAGGVVLLLLIGSSFFLIKRYDKLNSKNEDLRIYISEYIKGDSLISSDLNNLKKRWENQKPHYIIEKNKYQKIFFKLKSFEFKRIIPKFNNKIYEKAIQPDSTKLRDYWNPLNDSLNILFIFRESIDNKDFSAIMSNDSLKTILKKHENLYDEIKNLEKIKKDSTSFNNLNSKSPVQPNVDSIHNNNDSKNKEYNTIIETIQDTKNMPLSEIAVEIKKAYTQTQNNEDIQNHNKKIEGYHADNSKWYAKIIIFFSNLFKRETKSKEKQI